MFDLKNKRALITGGSGGIGSEVAKFLHGQGATVLASGTRSEALQSLVSSLGKRAYMFAGDLTNTENINRMIEVANGEMGGIDILVNNAGITRDSLVMRMKNEDWQKVIDINLNSVFKLSRNILKGMIKQRWGRIINITSVVGLVGNKGQANYAASKSGVTGMTKAMAQEVASRGITVNCIAPGYIASPMTEALSEEQKEGVLKAIAVGRLGDPKDIAACVIYLASTEAGYITGQTVSVNGGMVMI